MPTLASIISASAEALRPLLQEAFEAGRDVGREEAAADLRAKIVGVLSVGREATSDPATIVAQDLAVVASDKRATPGSVRPTIARLIVDSAAAGMTSQEIATLTGFKPNSVRGTLWTLGNEGLAVKRGGRWYPAPSSSEVSLNPSEGGVAEAGGGLR